MLLSGYSLFAEGPRRAVHYLASEAQARGIPVAVDAASAGFLREVGVATFLDWTAGFSMLFANAEEAALLCGEAELEAQMRGLGRHFGRVAIKRGALGAAIGGAEGVRVSAPAPEVSVVDTTGAGDCFNGALAAELANGALLPQACAFAVKASACKVERTGAALAMPNRLEIAARFG